MRWGSQRPRPPGERSELARTSSWGQRRTAGTTAGGSRSKKHGSRSTWELGNEGKAWAVVPTHGRLTERQRRILEVIHHHLEEHGYPPSVREIGDAVGLSSPSSVHAQLAQLEAKGFLRRDPTKPRALEVRVDPETELETRPLAARHIPLIGEIAAGAPLIAEERLESLLPLPRDLVGDGTLFILRVRGESMVDDGVLPGDLVVVRQQQMVEQGEMCAALIEGEATVKRFRRSRAGEVFLDPANAAYEPIRLGPSNDVQILGKVVAVLRKL